MFFNTVSHQLKEIQFHEETLAHFLIFQLKINKIFFDNEEYSTSTEKFKAAIKLTITFHITLQQERKTFGNS